MTKLMTVCAITPVASETWRVKVNVPVSMGVPEMTPVTLDKVSPEGKAPETIDHTYGGAPWVAMGVKVNAVPAGAVAEAGAVSITGFTTCTETRRDTTACAPSVTCTVNVAVPGAEKTAETKPPGDTETVPAEADPMSAKV